MDISDSINGLVQSMEGLLLWLNVGLVVRARRIQGVHWLPTAFFSGWGAWSVYYYHQLNQPWSFIGACMMLAPSLAWLALVVYYLHREE